MRLALVTVSLSFAACAPGEGDRCNPLELADIPHQGNCAIGFSCVYPTAPNCGVAYCCAVDATGKIADTNPNCQPDPTLAPACGLDLGAAPSRSD